jgi:hypothetical protein
MVGGFGDPPIRRGDARVARSAAGRRIAFETAVVALRATGDAGVAPTD